jgi:hypothetical protein
VVLFLPLEFGRTGALSFGAGVRAFGACDITFGACAEGLGVFGFALRGLTGFALGAALTLGDAFCVVTGLITDFGFAPPFGFGGEFAATFGAGKPKGGFGSDNLEPRPLNLLYAFPPATTPTNTSYNGNLFCYRRTIIFSLRRWWWFFSNWLCRFCWARLWYWRLFKANFLFKLGGVLFTFPSKCTVRPLLFTLCLKGLTK